MTDDGWTERLWNWADANGIDDNVLPRNKKDLINLNKLDFWKNKLTEIPKEIGNLTSLTELWLRWHQLTEIPKEIGNLTDLTVLSLDENQLTGLPKELINLARLTEFEPEPIPVYQEDKDKIKASIVNLRKKLSRYKTYCKNNEIEITGEVKKNIESVELLCKAADDVSQEAFLYEQTDYREKEYFPNIVIYALDSANIAWKPITEKCEEIEDVKRDGDMIGCFPWTSESYPWPNKAAPGIQVDLRRMSKLSGENLGDGLLQVWFDNEEDDDDISWPSVIRVIPRDVVEKEIPDDRFVDFIPNGSVKVAPKCWEEMNFPGWIITDYEMIGIQTDQGVELDGVSGEMYELMEELHVNDTSFFGVPDPIQNLWSEFYEKGQRNLLSLSSKEYFCIGTDDTGQLMYKKEEDGKISFSFYWSHY